MKNLFLVILSLFVVKSAFAHTLVCMQKTNFVVPIRMDLAWSGSKLLGARLSTGQSSCNVYVDQVPSGLVLFPGWTKMIPKTPGDCLELGQVVAPNKDLIAILIDPQLSERQEGNLKVKWNDGNGAPVDAPCYFVRQ